jgi:hypothetical protein
VISLPRKTLVLCSLVGLSILSSLAFPGVTQPVLANAPKPTAVGNTLLGLPRPTGAPAKPALMFGANAYDQQMLNFQLSGKPDSVCGFYQQQLAAKGYRERKVNTVVGQWGCNLVFDPATPISAKTAGKAVVLVIQTTALGPNSININARFEEI